jgi:hypothetical protein
MADQIAVLAVTQVVMMSRCLHGKLNDVETSDFFFLVNGNLASERTTRKIVIRIYRVALKSSAIL